MNLTVVERKTRLIGAILVERGLLTPDQLRDALELQAERGGMLGEIVTAEFGVSQVLLSQVIAEQLAELEAGAGAEPTAATARPQLKRVEESQDGETQLRVGDALLELGLVSREEIDAALEVQRETGERLGEVLVGKGVISRLELAGALSEYWSSLAKLRGPGEVVEPDEAPVTSPVSAAASDQLAGELAALGERVAGGDRELAAQLERLSVRIDELVAAPSDRLAGELAAQFERLSARFDELAAAGVSDQSAGRIGALDQGQRRVEEVLGRLVSDVAGLREHTDVKLDAIAAVEAARSQVSTAELEALLGGVGAAVQERVAGGDRELAAQFERLSVRFDVLAAAGVSDRLVERIGALDEAQRRGEELLGRLVSDVAGLREHADVKLDAVAAVEAAGSQVSTAELELLLEGVGAALGERVAGGDRELAAQVERLSVRFDELAAAPSDRLAGELAAQFERLSARFDELAAAGVSDRLVERIGALDEAQRREEELLGRLVSDVAGLREQVDARHDSTDLPRDPPESPRKKKKAKKNKKH